jgi:hypothetical protein
LNEQNWNENTLPLLGEIEMKNIGIKEIEMNL